MDSSKQLALRRPITSRRTGSVGGEVAAAIMERSSLATASFRVYYTLRPGAVPFLWESTPGTPKSAAATTAAVVTPKSAAAATASVAPADQMAAGGIDAAELPRISPPPSSYNSSQLKKGRCRARSPCPAPAGRVLRALLAALGVGGRSRRRPASQL